MDNKEIDGPKEAVELTGCGVTIAMAVIDDPVTWAASRLRPMENEAV